MSRTKIPVSYSFASDTVAVLRDVCSHYGCPQSTVVERATRRELAAIVSGGRLLDPPTDMPVIAPAGDVVSIDGDNANR